MNRPISFMAPITTDPDHKRVFGWPGLYVPCSSGRPQITGLIITPRNGGRAITKPAGKAPPSRAAVCRIMPSCSCYRRVDLLPHPDLWGSCVTRSRPG